MIEAFLSRRTNVNVSDGEAMYDHNYLDSTPAGYLGDSAPVSWKDPDETTETVPRIFAVHFVRAALSMRPEPLVSKT